jgi:hypothetical protein
VFQEQPMEVIPLLGPMQLQPGTTTIPLRLPAELRRAAGRGSTEAPAAPARPATLVLEGVSVDGGAMVEVALQASDGRRVPVGVINAFNETAPRHQSMDAAMAPAGRKAFDATSALAAVGGSEAAQLVLQPTTGVSGGAGGLETPMEAPRAAVRFSSVRVELH